MTRQRPPALRLLTALPNRWGGGKVHAAAYMDNPIWGRDWFPLCRGDHIHSSAPEEVSYAELRERVTCKICNAALARRDLRQVA